MPRWAITTGRYGAKQATTTVLDKHGSRHVLHFSLYSVKLYKAVARKSDGVVTWRFVRHLSGGHTVATTVERWAAEAARDRHVKLYPHGHIWHGCEV